MYKRVTKSRAKARFQIETDVEAKACIGLQPKSGAPDCRRVPRFPRRMQAVQDSFCSSVNDSVGR